MNRKLSRTMLMISVIAIFSFIGGMFFTKTIIPFFPITNAIDSNLDNEAIPQNLNGREVVNIEQDTCCGHTDTTPPTIKINSPKNNSFVLGGTTIDLNIVDDNRFYEY
ncbi:MAG: hypothetical protein ACXADY_20205, partial [Candidatus Hodarchaeales archaeon]